MGDTLSIAMLSILPNVVGFRQLFVIFMMLSVVDWKGI